MIQVLRNVHICKNYVENKNVPGLEFLLVLNNSTEYTVDIITFNKLN